jgi:hypothetical protein
MFGTARLIVTADILIGSAEAAAIEMLRDQSRSLNRKLVDVASAVVDGHPLLPKQPAGATSQRLANR